MTRKERIKKLLSGELPDYTRHHFDLTLCITDVIAEHYGYEREGVEEFIGNHLLQLDYTAPGGKDIVLFGALGSQSTIPTGTPEEVIAEAERTLEVLGKGERYIIGPAGSIPSETPLENVTVLVEFCRNLSSR